MDGSTYRFSTTNGMTPDIEHAIIGIVDEAGELAKVIKHVKIYNQELDTTNLVEEAGDIMWYLALLCRTLGVSFEEVWDKNIRKLQARYPEKYTEQKAKEANRNRQKEREQLEK
ncbi:MAG: nucleoside triphosphate pyrophosphohydrolase family protein [Chloroflexota bacterium]